MIRTICVVLFMAVLVIFAGLPLVLYTALSGSADRLYQATMWGLGIALRIGGVRIRVEGGENIPAGVCIFVANHSSILDPPVIAVSIPKRISFLAKKEVFRIPIIATIMRQGSVIPVDRSNRDAATASVDQAIGHLQKGISYIVFPEGTRSLDGRLRTFKKGSFVMAILARVPVVPVSIAGAASLMPKGSFAVHPGEVTVRFGRPEDAAAYSMQQRAELLARIHSRVAAGLPEGQQTLRGSAATAPTKSS
ncbi:MAG: lysophospholipid acyltransferase family protein [Candidatus Acidiferrales bacterium]